MSTLTHKGYGRIYCETETDAAKVKAIIKEIDEGEFTYLPADLIAPFSEYPKVVYTHKFSDMDMSDLTAVCWSRGIKIFAFDNNRQEYATSAIKLVTEQTK